MPDTSKIKESESLYIVQQSSRMYRPSKTKPNLSDLYITLGIPLIGTIAILYLTINFLRKLG